MSGSVFLYLTTRGRKTGLPRTIEIWFVEREGRYYLVAENRERAQWVRNLQAEPAVKLSVGTRDERGGVRKQSAARGRTIDPVQEPALAAEVRALMDAKYRWSEGLIVELAPTR